VIIIEVAGIPDLPIVGSKSRATKT